MLEETIAASAKKSAWKQLGKIRMGVKVATGRKPDCDHPQDELCYRCSRPKDLDYFVIPDAIKPILGPEPKELSIVLMNPKLEQCFKTSAAWYGQSGCNCYTGDSVTAMRFMRTPLEAGGFVQTPKDRQGRTEDAYKWTQIPCPGTKCEYRESKKCQASEYLMFGIPELGREWFGEWTMRSGSKTSAAQIFKTLQTLEEICTMRGRKDGIAFLRLKLRREAKEFTIDPKGNGKRSKVTKSIAVIDVDWNALLSEDQAMLLPLFGEQKSLLALPGVETTEAVVLSDAEAAAEVDEETGEVGKGVAT